MRVVPREIGPKIRFYSSHVDQWLDHASEIGSNSADVAALQAEVALAREAFMAQQVAHNAALAATHTLKLRLQAMEKRGSSIISQIRSKVRMEGNSVYALALISPPDSPSPLGKPGTPTRFTFQLDAIGQLHLKWKCPNPRGSTGTMYQVRRQISGERGFTFLGVTGKKQFTDATLPAGTPSAIYQITAIRSTARGLSAEFNVNLGVSGRMPAMFQAKNAA